jgi:hypothetical protein
MRQHPEMDSDRIFFVTTVTAQGRLAERAEGDRYSSRQEGLRLDPVPQGLNPRFSEEFVTRP